ncbi:MAG: LEA type 2 family protein [Acidobacteriota bacterium]
MVRIALGLLFAIASPLGLEVEPGRETFAATLRVPAVEASGDFQGRLALYGSRAEIPVAAVRISRAGEPLALRATIRYADIPADWVTHFRAEGFDYRLRGTLGGTPVEWAGRLGWEEVPVTGDETIISKFLEFEGVDLTALQANGGRGVARVRVTNPFAFPLQIARSEYRIEAEGRPVGRGATRAMVARRGTTRLDFPIEIDPAQLIAAAGTAFIGGGTVDARLRGTLTVRVAGHEVRVPLDVAGEIDAGSLGTPAD